MEGFDVILGFVIGMAVMFLISTYYNGQMIEIMRRQQSDRVRRQERKVVRRHENEL